MVSKPNSLSSPGQVGKGGTLSALAMQKPLPDVPHKRRAPILLQSGPDELGLMCRAYRILHLTPVHSQKVSVLKCTVPSVQGCLPTGELWNAASNSREDWTSNLSEASIAPPGWASKSSPLQASRMASGPMQEDPMDTELTPSQKIIAELLAQHAAARAQVHDLQKHICMTALADCPKLALAAWSLPEGSPRRKAIFGC